VAYDLDGERIAAFCVAFLTTAAMWWLYFNAIAGMAQRHLERSEDRTTTARDSYTYLHVVMVAGIIGAAVGDEIVIAHPADELHGGALAVVVGAPALYLLAHAAFRLRMARTLSPRRLGGAAACIATALLGGVLSALGIAAAVLAVLVVVLTADHVAARRRRIRAIATGQEVASTSCAGPSRTTPRATRLRHVVADGARYIAQSATRSGGWGGRGG